MENNNPTVGDVIGGYSLSNLIGVGGCGAVFRATEIRSGITVALKVISPNPYRRDDKTDDERRFRRECKIASGLSHPHIVPIHSFGEDDGCLYLAMHYVDGPNLAQYISNVAGGKLTLSTTAEVIAQTAKALSQAHQAYLIHRDVKPSNILIANAAPGQEIYAQLTDFGIARSLISGAYSSITPDNLVSGTPEYMPPEVWRGESAGPAADIYSLTCVLFECLTGRLPFPVRRAAQREAHLRGCPPRVREYVSELSTSVDRIVTRGMAERPEHRFSSVLELGEAVILALRERGRAHANRGQTVRPEPESRPVLHMTAWDNRTRLWDAGLGAFVADFNRQQLPRPAYAARAYAEHDRRVLALAGSEGQSNNPQSSTRSEVWVWDLLSSEPAGPPLLAEDLVNSIGAYTSSSNELVGVAMFGYGVSGKFRSWRVSDGTPVSPPDFRGLQSTTEISNIILANIRGRTKLMAAGLLAPTQTRRSFFRRASYLRPSVFSWDIQSGELDGWITVTHMVREGRHSSSGTTVRQVGEVDGHVIALVSDSGSSQNWGVYDLGSGELLFVNAGEKWTPHSYRKTLIPQIVNGRLLMVDVHGDYDLHGDYGVSNVRIVDLFAQQVIGNSTLQGTVLKAFAISGSSDALVGCAVQHRPVQDQIRSTVTIVDLISGSATEVLQSPTKGVGFDIAYVNASYVLL